MKHTATTRALCTASIHLKQTLLCLSVYNTISSIALM